VLNGVLQRLAYGNATRKPVLEIAHRVKQLIGMILRYAVATGRAERDCTADLKGFLPAHKAKNLPAITEPKRVGEVLRAIADYKGSAVVRSALRLAPLLAVRPGNLRAMEWAELDLEGGAWTIPAAKMKATKHEKETGQDFVVPLSTQTVAVLRELHPLTSHGKYCFPSNRGQSRFISDNAMNLALKSLGFSGQEQTVHGFRAMFRTMAAQELDEQDRYLEAALAHKPNDALGTSYNRTKFLEQRRRIMQTWADYLDKLKAGAEVIPLHGGAA
jgi:integrase